MKGGVRNFLRADGRSQRKVSWHRKKVGSYKIRTWNYYEFSALNIIISKLRLISQIVLLIAYHVNPCVQNINRNTEEKSFQNFLFITTVKQYFNKFEVKVKFTTNTTFTNDQFIETQNFDLWKVKSKRWKEDTKTNQRNVSKVCLRPARYRNCTQLPPSALTTAAVELKGVGTRFTVSFRDHVIKLKALIWTELAKVLLIVRAGRERLDGKRLLLNLFAGTRRPC